MRAAFMANLKRLRVLKQQSVDISKRIDSENPLRHYAQKRVSDSGLTYSDIQERLQKVRDCSSIVELKESWKDGPDGIEQILAVSAANFCKQHTICPVCADRSQSRRRARFNDSIKKQARLVQETAERIRRNEYDERDIENNRFGYMVTYTINDGERLSERLEHLKQSKRSFRRMGQRRKNGYCRSDGEAGKIAAAISTVEVKRGQNSRLWHAHIHELVFTDYPLDYEVYDSGKKKDLVRQYGNKWIPKEKLENIAKNRVLFRGELVAASKISEEWLESTGGDSMSIFVDRLQHVPRDKRILKDGKFVKIKISGEKKRRLASMTFEDSIAYQAKEILKYFVKTSENTPIDAITILEDTYNKRMSATYGQFRGVSGDDYKDPANKDQNVFVMQWDTNSLDYGDIQPGRIRDFMQQEEEHKARSACGKITGQYRRQRRALIEKSGVGDDLSHLLDDAKIQYRSAVRGVWRLYQQAVETLRRAEKPPCDKYSVVALSNGFYSPGSDRRLIYQSIFT